MANDDLIDDHSKQPHDQFRLDAMPDGKRSIPDLLSTFPRRIHCVEGQPLLDLADPRSDLEASGQYLDESFVEFVDFASERV